ncbi:MAG TPA: ribokinase [Thermoflexia bacterium]|nr:ribokinase [Thermoflexia bacterium]
MRYLAIGHVTQDRTPDGGFTVGGTVTYAARTAQALGCRVQVVTSAADGLDLTGALAGVIIHRIRSAATTTFENRYTPEGRTQIVRSVAALLTSEAVPPSWREPDIVHLGPVAQECDPSLVDLFPGAFLGLTPQGWMRRWDREGRVVPAAWEHAEVLLPRADAVVFSEEDVAGDEAVIARWAGQTRILVVTRGPAGCTLYVEGVPEEVPGFPALEADPTGAGDIFAAVFFVELRRGCPPLEAARLANCIAAVSVTRPGLQGTPSRGEVARCRAVVCEGRGERDLRVGQPEGGSG